VATQPDQRVTEGPGPLGDRAPLTIRVYWLWSVLIAGSAAAKGVSEGRIAGSVLILAIVVAMASFVYRRSKAAWIILVAAPAVRAALAPFAKQTGWVILIEVVSVLLLIAPQSVRFIWADRGEENAQRKVRASDPEAEFADVRLRSEGQEAHPLDPRPYRDDQRPVGWYVNPESPRRMRYWSENQGWAGSTRTPRAVLREWRQREV
jgi:hypothetical protein